MKKIFLILAVVMIGLTSVNALTMKQKLATFLTQSVTVCLKDYSFTSGSTGTFYNKISGTLNAVEDDYIQITGYFDGSNYGVYYIPISNVAYVLK